MRWVVVVVAVLVLAPSARGEGPRFGARLRMIERRALPPERGDGTVSASVRVAGGARALRAAGFAAREGAGELAYVEVAVDELARLRALPGVRAIERPLVFHPTLDRSTAASGAPQARAALGLDGRGAIVGVVDTGADFRHADLRGDDGSTRLLALLDVGTPRDGRHPGWPDYGGAVWTADEIDAALIAEANGGTAATPIPEKDVVGHGTHVASIAASTGLATARRLPAGRYVGMAPGASLVVAKVSRAGDGFAEQDVLSGVRFALDRAAAVALPAVVNLSLGTDGGPHDGTTNFERALADLVPPDAPGRALVVAAGNSGSRDHHAGGWLLDGAVEIAIAFPANTGASGELAIDVWTDATLASLTLVAPDGRAFGPVAGGKTLDGGMLSEGHVVIDAGAGGADPIDGRVDAGAVVQPPSAGSVSGGTWKLVLAGRCRRWDAWLGEGSPAAAAARFADHLDEDDRADSPAYSPAAIAVGSYVSRDDWRTLDGRTIRRPTTVGADSSFSGTGPTADGRFLPDVAAPGDFVLAAMSRDAPPTVATSVFAVPSDPGYLVGDDGLHGALRGTSQAAPHVAGAIALLFQLDPTLSTNRLRELLRTAASLAPGEPGYSTRGGFGRLDVLRAARLLRRDPTGAVDPAASSVGVSRDALPAGERTIVTVVARDASGAPLGPGHAVAIAADAGAFDGPERTLSEGRVERTLVAAGSDPTAAHVAVTVDGVALDVRPIVWFTADRARIGAPSANGCALGDRPASPVGAALALAALALVLALRRR